MINLIKNEFKKNSLFKLITPIFLFIIIMYIIYISNEKKSLLKEIYNYIPFIGITNCILFSNVICGELTSGNLRFYLTKPISRTKIIISKFIFINIYSILFLLIIFLFKCFLSNALNISIFILYIKYSFILLIINTLIVFLSVVNRNSTINSGILIFIISFGSVISQILYLIKIKIIKYTFLPYIDLSIFKNDLFIIFNASVNKLILFSTLYSIILFSASILIFNKKDINY